MDLRDLSTPKGRAFWARIEKKLGVKLPIKRRSRHKEPNRPNKQSMGT